MKPDNDNRMDDLLVKYMLGEATPAEQQQVQEWRSKNTGNELYFNQLATVWEKSRNLAVKSTVSENDAWKRFQQRVQETPSTTPVIPLHRKTRTSRWAAAAVVLLAVAGWLLYATVLKNATTTITAGNNVITDTLPDGSVITLNKNATLSYDKSFNTSIRNVTLEGEGFFTIATDKSRPFIITTGNDVAITVLGTSFNVKAGAEETEVIVETGMVEVRHKQQAIRLKQKERITISGNKKKLSKEVNKSELYNHYRTHSFVCKNTPLSELVAKLNEVYEADIVIANNKIANEPIDVTFHEESLDRIIEIVTKTQNISSRKEQNRIILE